MTPWIGFLRGINVGRAKRIAMADLRDLCESLGHQNVRTVLNSGNVVFDSRAKSAAALSASLEAALNKTHGFHANTVFVALDELQAIMRASPFGKPANPSQFLIAFPYDAQAMQLAAPLKARAWAPDRVAFAEDAIYLDAASGLLKSALVNEFMRITKDTFTTRNWATVGKVIEAANTK
ncbi:MAG: DUF1697 domain-containing protein [Betaproteobacteria bacterium]|nr:DUF1697 domain-containing protein [Betaproteobacteria bacterium]